MKTQIAATFVGGVFKPDESLALPEGTRVVLTIQPPFDEAAAKAAWKSLQERLRQRPIDGGGKRFTRDELHERR
jgi:predicted DNA-binding antitoxin AbrB/MazE fold protein